MEVYIPEQQFDGNAHSQYFANSKVGTLDVLGATLDDTLYYNPLNAANRFFEQHTGQGKTGKLLTAQEYIESEFYREGMEVPKNGITTGLAELLAERRDRRDTINLSLSRSRGGAGLLAAQFGVGLAGSFLDPLNVASAFIPSLGAAKLGIMMQRHGKTGGRFVAGARDGFIGAAVLEPIVAGQAYLENDRDYTAMDSFLNLTFGTVMGGGLHAGFGKLSDRIQKSKAKNEALITGVAQATADQEINVSNLHIQSEKAEAKSAIDRANQRIQRQTGAVERTIDPETGEVKTEKRMPVETREIDPETGLPVKQLKRKGNFLPPILRPKAAQTLLQFIRSKKIKIDPNSQGADNLKSQIPVFGSNLYKKGGMTVDEAFQAAREEGFFPMAREGEPDDADMRMLVDALIDEHRGGVPKYRDADVGLVEAADDAETLSRVAKDLGIDPRGLDDQTFMNLIEEVTQNKDYFNANTADPYADYDVVDTTPVTDGAPLTEQESFNIMQEARIEDYRLGQDKESLPALKEQDEKGFDIEDVDEVKLKQETERLEADVAQMDAAGVLRQEDRDLIAFSNEQIAKSEGYEELARAGAVCMNRNFTG